MKSRMKSGTGLTRIIARLAGICLPKARRMGAETGPTAYLAPGLSSKSACKSAGVVASLGDTLQTEGSGHILLCPPPMDPGSMMDTESPLGLRDRRSASAVASSAALEAAYVICDGPAQKAAIDPRSAMRP